MNLAERLKMARESARLSQRELSARATSEGHPISAGQIAKIEVADRPNPRASDLAVIARITGVNLSWLVSGIGPMVPTETSDVAPFDAAKTMFLAQETHDGRGEEARVFLAERSTQYAGAEDKSPGWWLESLRDEYRAWRRPGQLPTGARELGEGERPGRAVSKINVRKR
jgi:transcriptional regulator with XRE-family HTH domain